MLDVAVACFVQCYLKVNVCMTCYATKKDAGLTQHLRYSTATFNRYTAFASKCACPEHADPPE
jgi:hypothetical protein